jgi:endonuclease/exonuclease/phosphatase family metal-dependent hydrolase
VTHEEIQPVATATAGRELPSMTSTTLTVATANTCTGELLRTPGGLEPFRTAGAGVVGLQEVFGITEPELRAALAGAGLELTHWHAPAGLVIAHDPRVAALAGEPLVTTLKAAGPLLRYSNHWHERAMLSAAFETAAGPVAVSTAHLIVFARAHARTKQVRALREALEQDRLRRGPHVLMGDMNHYPRPAAADRAMHEAGGFTHVPLHEPTWLVSGSKHEWLARLAAVATRRDLASFDAQLDVVLYRDLRLIDSTVVDVASDHRAVVCDFQLGG